MCVITGQCFTSTTTNIGEIEVFKVSRFEFIWKQVFYFLIQSLFFMYIV